MIKKYIGSNGFTLLELLVVIVVIGIVSIFALPKYINLSTDSQLSAVNNIAATLSTANAENYAARNINVTNGSVVKNCTSAANLLQNGLPDGYSIKSEKVGVNATVQCTLKGPSSTKATFLATGIL